MVKTRRSLNGDVDDGDYRQNDITSVTVEKRVPGWTQRELRSNRYRVTRKLPHWPAKLVSKRLRTIKMPRIVFPESDTEPEKYSRRRRPVKVYFAGETDTGISRRRGRRTRPPPNYMEDSGDKPIQHNVRRSGRQRKLLHHNFNESWITNELKVKGYPKLYGQLSHMCTSSSESSSDDEQTRRPKRMTRTSNGQNHTDEDVPVNNRNKRTSARSGANKKQDASESDMENHNHEPAAAESNKTSLADGEDSKMESGEDNTKSDSKIKDVAVQDNVTLDSESNQGRGMRLRRTRQIRDINSCDKKNTNRIQRETASDTDGSSDSGSAASEIMMRTRRQSNRTRKPNASFVELGKRQHTQARQAKSYTIRKKPYSLRERKPPKIIVRSQSPSSSSSCSSSDTEEDLNVSVKNKTKGRQKSKSMGEVTERALRDIQPLEVDGSVRFSSVGGLEEHIRCLREMVLFPLMYPQLFQKFGTRPAKGVLFHGPPGTGKTLLARALSNECSIQGGQKVSFFMRKGADCLKKWVGESERHIKLLFQQASKMKPSIIFFDEIDALAPVRSVRQEQVHTSVVGTLLAEMDGLCDRGEVVVIGATNRLDAVDPALRRAGRFDRELYFPPPHASARRDILHIYTKHWEPRPSKQMLDYVADITSGYGGSDLKALCSESVLKALRRVYPQVYLSEHALLIDTHKVAVTEADMVNAIRGVVAAGSRTAPPPARPLPPALSPLLAAQVQAALDALRHIYPLADKELALDPDRHLTPSFLTPPAMLISGECAGSHIAPALLASIEHCTVKEISVASLHGFLGLSLEQAIMTMFAEVRRVERGCVVYAPAVDVVWSMLGAAGARLLIQLWASAGSSCLLLATSETPHHQLPEQLQSLFPAYNDCIYNVRDPTEVEVLNFLKPVIVNDAVEPPYLRNSESLPELPRAPPPPPPRPSSAELARRKRVEDYKLRELRIFLRDVCRKLAANRRFYKFTKPVDLDEVTDYLTIVSQPMDLETMMTKVDMHRYNSAKEFLSDVDLICANALEYNPDRTSSDKQIRHEACSLRDHAHALIDVEMDSDFEMECQEITRRRAQEGTLNETDLPSFIYTSSSLVLPDTNASADDAEPKATPHHSGSDNIELSNHTPAARRKRRRLTAWSKGLAKKPKTSHKPTSHFKQEVQQPGTDEESKENKPLGAGLNGDGSDQRSDQDEPDVRHVNASDKSEMILQLHKTDGVKGERVLECTKSSEKSSATLLNKSQSPRKRNNSGHDSSTSDGDKIIINKTELAVIFKNTKPLRTIGIKALISLHSQLEHVTQKYRQIYDRSKLPSEISAIISKYMHHFDHK